MCEFALGCVNEMWVWCMCDILWVREQSIDVRCNVLVKVLNHQVMIWIFEMFIGCIYYSIDVRYQVIFTKCVHVIWWAVLCVSVCACVNMRCEMCELPFCVVICWSHRIYCCHLMEPSSWIIGTSRVNFGVLPVIGCCLRLGCHRPAWRGSPQVPVDHVADKCTFGREADGGDRSRGLLITINWYQEFRIRPLLYICI